MHVIINLIFEINKCCDDINIEQNNFKKNKEQIINLIKYYILNTLLLIYLIYFAFKMKQLKLKLIPQKIQHKDLQEEDFI